MKLLTTAQEHDKTVRECLRKFSQVRFAVAWATQQFELGHQLTWSKSKVKRAVIGTHFFQTDPEFMRAWMDHPNVRFNFRTAGVFHPKVYLFENSPSDWAVIVGSANFTRGGFVLNSEASLFVTSDTQGSEQVYAQTHSLINSYFDPLDPLTKEEMEKYIDQRNARRNSMRDIAPWEDDQLPAPEIDFKLSEVLDMDWNNYSRAIGSAYTFKFEDRVQILNIFRQYFASKGHFSQFSLWEQKRVAGLAPKEGLVDWQLFGSNTVAGEFNSVFEDISGKISIALDEIPITGPVSREAVERYIALFREAKDKGVAVGIMTRILAMKRPDQFVCVNGKSKNRLAGVLRTSVGTISKLENYWESVVEPIRSSPWWKSPNPSGGQTVDLWHGRVALLDCICYERDSES